MRTRFVVICASLVVLVAALLLSSGHLAPRVQAAGGCNASAIQGMYAFSGQGFRTNAASPVPQAINGLVQLTATVVGGTNGTLSGSMTTSNGGVITQAAPLTGTFTVTGCFVGKATFQSNTGMSHYQFVWLNSATANAVRIFFNQTDSHRVVTLTLERFFV